MFCGSYSQATAGIALQTFVCLFMQFSPSAKELSKKGALVSGCNQLILLKLCWDVSVRFLCFFFSFLRFFPEKRFLVRKAFSFHGYIGHVS